VSRSPARTVVAVAVSSRSGDKSNAANDASVRQRRDGANVDGRLVLTGDRPTASCSICAAPAAAVDGDPDRVDVVPLPSSTASPRGTSPVARGDARSVSAPAFRRRRLGRRCCSQAVLSCAANFSTPVNQFVEFITHWTTCCQIFRFKHAYKPTLDRG